MKSRVRIIRKLFAKKIVRVAAAGAVLLTLLLTAFLMAQEPPIHTFAAVSGVEPAEVQRLTIKNDITGEQLSVDNQSEMSALLEILTPLSFQTESVGEEASASNYTVDLYRNGNIISRLIFARQRAVVFVFAQGAPASETTYAIGFDITPHLDMYFNQLFAARQQLEQEADLPPLEVSVREIVPAISVVINNYPTARPTSGLQLADIVYEFLAEGGTTRYLAIFRRKHLENFIIGPVRSLRPYLAQQSLEYGGIIAHSGSSLHTNEMISGLNIFQITDAGKNFWRDQTRRMPDNLYTSLDNLYRASLRRIRAVNQTYFIPQEVKPGYVDGSSVEIKYTAHNLVSFRYDPTQEIYYRYINGEPHTDRETRQQYYAHRVIIRRTPHRYLPGPEGLVQIDLSGSGAGMLYEQGRKYIIRWESDGTATTYYFEDGQPVAPIPRVTWIQIVP